jgi:hypothetical protein
MARALRKKLIFGRGVAGGSNGAQDSECCQRLVWWVGRVGIWKDVNWRTDALNHFK